jgi:UbiD family decarboxylase
MAYKDLRKNIQDFEAAGELHRVKAEVDWDVELSAIMRRVFKVMVQLVYLKKLRAIRPQFLPGLYLDIRNMLSISMPNLILGISWIK